MRGLSSSSHPVPTCDGHTVRVSTLLKVAVGLLLTLPLGAYIAGTLVASQAAMPSERAPIVIETTTATTPSASPTTPAPSRTPRPAPTAPSASDDHDDDSGIDDSDDRVRVVRPSPHDVDDDHDDRHDTDDRDDTDDGGDDD